MASDIVYCTSNYITAGAQLSGATWAVGDNVYITKAELKAVNVNTLAFTNQDFGTNGIVGVVQEAPDLTVSGDRMVIRLTGSATLNARIKTLLQATEL